MLCEIRFGDNTSTFQTCRAYFVVYQKENKANKFGKGFGVLRSCSELPRGNGCSTLRTVADEVGEPS